MIDFKKLLDNMKNKITAYILYIERKQWNCWLFTIYSDIKRLKSIYIKENQEIYNIDTTKKVFTYNLLPIFIIVKGINHNVMIKDKRFIEVLKQKLKDMNI